MASDSLCTFCDRPLDGSLEHILLSALGGQKWSRRVICGDHNNTFGRTIDDVLAKQLAFFCNLLAIQTGRGETAATIRDLQTTDGQRIDLHPGGKFVARPQFEDDEIAPGKRQIRISAQSEEQLRSHADTYLKKYGRNVDGLEDVIIEKRIDTGAEIAFNGEVGGEDAFRAVAKMGLVLLASEVGTEAVRGADTERVRRFITTGGASDDVVRWEYQTDFPRIPEFVALPASAHRIAAFADPAAQVAVALVDLFGAFRFTVLLSERWSGPAIALQYGVDPATGNDVEVRTGDRAPLTAVEFRGRKGTSDEAGACLQELFGHIKRRQVSLSIESIGHESVIEALPPERLGTEITPQDVDRIVEVATGRFMAEHGGVPYRQRLDETKVLRPSGGSPIKTGRRRRRTR